MRSKKFIWSMLIPLLFLGIIVLCIFLWMSYFKPRDHSCKKCNIVVIDIDILREDALACGTEEVNAPNICKFSQKAMYFNNNISHSDLTRPSLLSMLTSLYPYSHTIWSGLNGQLNTNVVTLADLLTSNNYHTVFIGDANHEQTQAKGFSEIIMETDILKKDADLTPIVEKLFQSHQPIFIYLHTLILHFPYLELSKFVQPGTNGYPPPKGLPTTWEEYNQSLAEYVATHYAEVFRPEVIEAHPELFQGDVVRRKDNILDLYQSYKNMAPEARMKLLKNVWDIEFESFARFIDIRNSEHTLYLKSNYLALLKLIDAKIAGLLNLLSTTSLADNTIVVIRSDHGEEFGEHGQLSHQNNLYQELIHVPLIIKAPSFSPGKIDEPTQDIDIMPTLLDLVKFPPPAQAQGKSLLPSMLGKGASVNTYQIAQRSFGEDVAFIKGGWKLIVLRNQPAELYDLSKDPKEKHNIILQEKDRASHMLEDYRYIIGKLEQYPGKNSIINSIDEETRKKLIEKGYF